MSGRWFVLHPALRFASWLFAANTVRFEQVRIFLAEWKASPGRNDQLNFWMPVMARGFYKSFDASSLDQPELVLATLLEYLGNGALVLTFDLFVGVEKPRVISLGKSTPDCGLAGAHESDYDDVTHEASCPTGRHRPALTRHYKALGYRSKDYAFSGAKRPSRYSALLYRGLSRP